VKPSQAITQYITTDTPGKWEGNILTFPVELLSLSAQANAYYFGHPKWGRDYLEACHQDEDSKARWQAVIGSWQSKTVVDIGCGPGNVYRALRDCCGTPSLLIGIDFGEGALEIAQELGYEPVLADAQKLPFMSGFADVVILNATIHHSDDMESVLREAARIVRPGGLLLTDYDVQRSMWNDNPIAKLIWNLRLPFYQFIRRGGHATAEEQYWSTTAETHHRPGDGVTRDFYHRILEPLGFDVQVYPHNRTVGASALEGEMGKAKWNIRFAQRLCGVNPDSPETALILMSVSRRHSVISQ